MIAAAALGFALAATAPPAEFLGKTPDQILAMGHGKWSEFAGEKSGYSTAAMVDAETGWGQAFRIVNNRRILRLPAAKRKAIGEIRVWLTSVANHSAYIGYIRSGGGTLWHPIFAGLPGSTEEAIQALMNERIKVKKGDANAILAGLRKKIDEDKADIEAMRSSGGSYSDAIGHCDKAGQAYSRLLKSVAPFGKFGSKWAAAYGAEAAEVGAAMDEPG